MSGSGFPTGGGRGRSELTSHGCRSAYYFGASLLFDRSSKKGAHTPTPQPGKGAHPPRDPPCVGGRALWGPPGWPAKRRMANLSPDRPVLSDFLRASSQALSSAVGKAVSAASVAVASVDQAAASERSRASAEKILASTSIPPWQTLAEQYSILEDELRERILSISQKESHFTDEAVRCRRRRPGNILPGCLPMANAALEADHALKALRFKLVPARLAEEDFWRACVRWSRPRRHFLRSSCAMPSSSAACLPEPYFNRNSCVVVRYFWHVAQLKCELLNDWQTANGARRDAALEDEASLAPIEHQGASVGDPHAAVVNSEAGQAVATDPVDLDAEFERLVASPSRVDY